MDNEVAYQISEIAKQSGVSLRTVRFYQQKGLIVPSLRTSSGMSLYSQKDVNRVKLIRRLKDTGMSLNRILDILDAGGETDRKAKAEHTLKVLKLEAENAASRIAELERQSRERKEIISLVSKCLGCDMEVCPQECPPRNHLIY
ncbi:MerR family transcriptional regulator [Dehalococcoides mccartyi]|jgi:MerR family Zn(II)-responsive transcriptional regulator of zntA|uniref:MerR family transcriptional regulator n=1 Tax=Dehalococcoides mccartyi TaxID=61435 RepID=UPI00099DB58D|nr:MerR family transcriptional regulator [Dehalococcoides mccartyi]AQX75212.1 MerR family transcriptional regulator [Dehalococcoides mccartyi]AQY73789.1 MerR family transcriptional regulator [Dehalococcoides mccartyi]